jgi:hypothetical protein
MRKRCLSPNDFIYDSEGPLEKNLVDSLVPPMIYKITNDLGADEETSLLISGVGHELIRPHVHKLLSFAENEAGVLAGNFFGNDQLALGFFDRARRINPENHLAHENLGIALNRLGNMERLKLLK